ncbi:hypothetical protein [Dactylosporangium sp. NPDC051541]|uniref:hypothetical protein n=1 Tax=Dactylosporangium sp. NPDC051541 TaxID=3363977 RepID=UPI00378AB363
MTGRVDEMLIELDQALQHVSAPCTSADRADRIYEVYAFAQVIAAAAESGAMVVYEDADERPVKELIFRGAPGVLHGGRQFTHAVLSFGDARPVEVHVRVKVRGKVSRANPTS